MLNFMEVCGLEMERCRGLMFQLCCLVYLRVAAYHTFVSVFDMYRTLEVLTRRPTVVVLARSPSWAEAG